MTKYRELAFWIIAFQLVSLLIRTVTRGNMDWYDTLPKSALTPPDIAFLIIWTVLYVLLALVGWKTWVDRKQDRGTPFRLFWMQIFLNWGWSFVFFGFHLVGLGLVWIVALLGTMAVFVAYAWKHQRMAALLVIPIMVWGCFAAYLNFAIWMLNS